MDQDAIPEDLDRRIDALTERSTLTRSRIIEDALSNGRTLAWQERWVAGIEQGLAEADRGEFASEDELAAVLNRYAAG
ncbi:ribbon-helix-helix protein, CopG family [Methylopila sp. M107]|uniref:CopG family ribbon-helix-helix protein n=1 Tax=Methylopila sp. M107 TaxID=1101190 RepID=UPI000373CF2E|nr:ribbon-helix-helix protein, CopG family [Methylopila sp. M107]